MAGGIVMNLLIAFGLFWAVAGLYGTLGPIGFPRRSVFIVDADGVIRYAHRAIAGLTYRPVSELVEVLQGLTKPA